MPETAQIELSVRGQKSISTIISKTIDDTGIEAEQKSNSELVMETIAMTGESVIENEKENGDMQNTSTLPTCPKPEERANSYFEAKDDRPSTRGWMSLLHRNLAANPGSSQHIARL